MPKNIYFMNIKNNNLHLFIIYIYIYIYIGFDCYHSDVFVWYNKNVKVTVTHDQSFDLKKVFLQYTSQTVMDLVPSMQHAQIRFEDTTRLCTSHQVIHDSDLFMDNIGKVTRITHSHIFQKQSESSLHHLCSLHQKHG